MNNPPRLREDNDADWRLPMAGALAGAAAGGFVVAMLSHVYRASGWYVGSYEPLAALCAGLGCWFASPQGGVKSGLIGGGAALAAMLLGDLFREMSFSLLSDWHRAPLRVLAHFTARNWPKLVRYGFGVYLGWHLAVAGSSRAAECASADEEGEE